MPYSALIQVMFAARPNYGVVREQLYLWPPLSVTCEVSYPRDFDDDDFTEERSDTRLVFRGLFFPEAHMMEQLQGGNVLIIHHDQIYRVETSSETRDGTMRVVAQRERAYDADDFTELESGDRVMVAGGAILGTGSMGTERVQTDE